MGKDMDARMIYEISNKASQFVSDIKLISKEIEVDVKSIMGLLFTIYNTKNEIILHIEGGDEEIAKNAMREAFLTRGFKVSFAA